MPRVQNLFALTSLLLLVFGLASSIWSSGLSITAGQKTFFLGFGVPLFGAAAVFCICAFLYSIVYLPFSPMMAKWHFWLSFVGVALLITGGAIFWFGARTAKEPWRLGVTAIGVSVSLGILTFLTAQMWFLVDFARVVLQVRKA